MSDNRPTKEQLQTALATAEHSRPPRYVAVLAAEVRALLRDLEGLKSESKVLDSHCDLHMRELRALREERDLFRTASEAAELSIVELREELGRERGASKPELRKQIQELESAIARVEALCDMQHADRLIRVGDIRTALRGQP